MSRYLSTLFSLVALGVVAVVAFLHLQLAAATRNESSRLRSTVEELKDSVVLLRRQVDSLRTLAPGLGDYMSQVQLHVSKLWFAANAANWGLAKYELGELGEAVEGAKGLHARKDSVDVTSVLASVHDTQFALLGESIAKGNLATFKSAYSQTLAACNGCHRPAGYPFIHIVPPRSEPVSNQEWKPAH